MFKVRMILLNVVLSVALTAGAQVQERTFYVDFGQNNVSGQGYKTTGADKNKHYWNNIFGKGTGAPDKAYPQTINLLTSDNKQTDLRLQLSSRFSTNGYTNGGLQSPSAALLGDLAIESATQDYIFLEANQDYAMRGTTASSTSRDSTLPKPTASTSSARAQPQTPGRLTSS